MDLQKALTAILKSSGLDPEKDKAIFEKVTAEKPEFTQADLDTVSQATKAKWAGLLPKDDAFKKSVIEAAETVARAKGYGKGKLETAKKYIDVLKSSGVDVKEDEKLEELGAKIKALSSAKSKGTEDVAKAVEQAVAKTTETFKNQIAALNSEAEAKVKTARTEAIEGERTANGNTNFILNFLNNGKVGEKAIKPKIGDGLDVLAAHKLKSEGLAVVVENGKRFVRRLDGSKVMNAAGDAEQDTAITMANTFKGLYDVVEPPNDPKDQKTVKTTLISTDAKTGVMQRPNHGLNRK